MLAVKNTSSDSSVQLPQSVPARVLEIELSSPLPIISPFDEKTQRRYQRAVCLVRLHTQPLDMIEIRLSEEGASPHDYAELIWHRMKDLIIQHLQTDGLPAPDGLDAAGLSFSTPPRCLEERARFLEHAPFVSVIIPTRDRIDYLPNCLEALMKLEYPHYEVIVVDNGASDTATADFMQQHYSNEPRVRYIQTDRPGASRARNLGMMAARGEILAFADDDTVPDAHWLTALAQAFYHVEKVVCVAGYFGPLRLDTPAQLWGEEFVKVEDGERTKFNFKQRIMDSKMRHTHLYTLGTGGSGNMAVTAAFLRHIGGFDPALGPGTPTEGAEDIEILLQANMHGCTAIYEPAAIVYHHHRPDFEEMFEQIHGFGLGYGAFLVQSIIRYPQLLIDLIVQIFSSLRARFSAKGQTKKTPVKKKKGPDRAHEVIPLLLKGLFSGPFAYMKSRLLQHNKRAVRGLRKPTTTLWLAPVNKG